jgi:predicted kinase
VKPLLILVGGPSGCGKTTLARALGETVGIVHLSRDSVKSAIAITDATISSDGGATINVTKAAMGGENGQRGFVVAYEAVALLLAGGASVVMDQAWRRGTSEAELAPLLAISRPVLVTVVASPAVAATRTERRRDRPGLAPLPEAVASLHNSWDDFLGLDLDIPQLVVDTSTGYTPSLSEIAAWIWQNAH